MPESPVNCARAHTGESLGVTMGAFELMLESLHKAFEDNLFSSVPIYYNWDIDFLASVWSWAPKGVQIREANVLFWFSGLRAVGAVKRIAPWFSFPFLLPGPFKMLS